MSLPINPPLSLRLFCAFCLTALFCFAAPQSLARESIGFDAAPDWVIAAEIPAEDPEQVRLAQDGVHYLLSDAQSRIEQDVFTHYRRTTMKVLNRAGLEEAARLQYSFDPLDDVFRIHTVTIIRDGERIDKLDPDTAIVARRESDMANGVTDGDLTVYYEIPDVRVGDIVDYAISWETRSPIWPGAYSRSISTEWSVPLQQLNVRILINGGRTLTIRNRKTSLEPAVTEAGEWREYIWKQTSIAPVAQQSKTPQTFANWGEVSVSTFSGWGDVSKSLVAAYAERMVLPSDAERRFDWLTDARSSNERITAAIRYVQDEIRYVADETGVGSHLPRTPEEVIARGWGDCKDKSLLLAALLRRIGVEADVALVDTDEGRALPQMAPSPYAFDHAIVLITLEGTRYWIDPTGYDQGGVFPVIAQASYGYGLPIRAGADALIEMEAIQPAAPEKLVREVFDFSGFDETGFTLRVTSDYVGKEADSFRRSFSANSVSQLSTDYLAYYQKRYPGLTEAAPIDVSDDRDGNTIRVIESYRAERADYEGDEIDTSFPLRADAVLGIMESVPSSGRTAPIALSYPIDYQHIIVLEQIGDTFDGPDPFSAETDHFSFVRGNTFTGGDATFSYRLKTFAPEAPLAEMETYNGVAEDLDDWGYFDFIPNAEDEPLTAEDIGLFALVLAMFAAIIYLPFAIYARLKRDDAVMDQGVFHPVSLPKFLILSVISLGLYSVFWMWRCWRWQKRTDSSNIMPFWRAYFSFIWFYPLFAAIREEQEAQKTPVFIGVLLAVAYAVLTIFSTIAERVFEDQPLYLGLVAILSLSVFFCVAPLVVWVNRLNIDRPDAIAANSRWHGHAFGMLAVGALIWGLAAYGTVMPE